LNVDLRAPGSLLLSLRQPEGHPREEDEENGGAGQTQKLHPGVKAIETTFFVTHGGAILG